MSSALPHEVRIFDDRPCELGEGPVWDEVNGRAVWVDILGSRVLWRNVTTSEVGEFHLPAHVGAVLPTDDGRWLACLVDGVYVTDLLGTDVSKVADFPHRHADGVEPTMRANDAKVSPDGYAFCGTMSYTPDAHPDMGSLYVLDEGRLRSVVDRATISNGIGWSPDGSTIYYVDSPTGRIDAAPYMAAGRELRWRSFATVDAELGLPDGLAVDSEGSVWLAVWGAGRILKFSASGRLIGYLEVPCPQTTSCAFVGSDLTTLLITTAHVGLDDTHGCGLTYAVDLPVPGIEQPRVLA